ncbi:hypothetical protein BRADI_3g17242v3 [Brachypodium distachyon]|uniref:Protein FAR1-RELATED SEQUENCE n=1 Tax=Brachypodium distachyon TaxID=15368 RepID=A0A0Q3FB50_BRADI|nr:hypothetical protein BRADI_3g17242v3 [Brachypodium distachyon]
MAKAIPQIFPRSLHKLCRWHIMRKHKDSLGKLYKLFPDLKDQLAAVLNHPLMPTEFEAAWHELVNKYNLHDVNVMINLWNERKTWVSAYWKDVFCARMTSTQRSESMNHVLKKGFVREQHDLHVFAQQVNNCIQTRHESEAAEATASMEFSWSRHEFRVLADEAEGIFGCECKFWEHTGLFCLHVIVVFEHLRLDEIPRRYILKRYTKNAVADPVFNRRDYKMAAKDGTSLEYMQTMMFNEAMKTVNRGMSSDHMFNAGMRAFKEVNSRMDEEGIETNAEADHHTEDFTMKKAGTLWSKKKDGPPAPAHVVAAARPEPELDTHGNPRGQRLCSNCNKLAGHNARTCKKRPTAGKLLEAHQKVYGASPTTDKVKIRIRNVLAKQIVGIADNEQLLDTDEDEDYEDQTDDDENEDDVEDYDENEDDQGGEGEEEEQYQTEVTNEQTLEATENSKPTPVVPEGQRTCSICKKKASHNSRTCPDKDEILKKQLE